MWWESVVVIACVAVAAGWLVRSLVRSARGGTAGGCSCSGCPASPAAPDEAG